MSEQRKRAVTTELFSLGMASLLIAGIGTRALAAQAPDPSAVLRSDPSSIALPLPEDRGADALEESLRRLRTTGRVMMIVAHPDDEDGPLLTYLSRALGMRATLFTLTRGEGGQNAMSADTYDALGLLRTNELLTADQYYGVKQLWGTEADFGFSKTQEEAFARWGHERVLYDAVLAVRRERPQVIVATFVGAVSDGHGQHQVSGEIAQEVFKAAADPHVFPDQLKDGLTPWQPLAVYGMVPFAPITDKGMFDYATGHWAPAEFKNYITGETLHGALSADATIPVGDRDPILGRSYVQIARQGWGEQKSQYGGASPALSGPASTRYHLWAAAPMAQARPASATSEESLFHNRKVDIDTSFAGLARLLPASAPQDITDRLRAIDAALAEVQCPCGATPAVAHKLAAAYKQVLDLRQSLPHSGLDAQSSAALQFELDNEIDDFQSTLKEVLGLELTAFTTKSSGAATGMARGSSADEMPASVTPGEEFHVRVHITQANHESRIARTWLASQSGGAWKSTLSAGSPDPAAPVADAVFTVHAADDAQPTAPYFTRPTIEQPYYDISNPAWRGRSFEPWPLAAWVEFTYDGVPIRLGEVVQTLQRVTGPGGFYQPLVVTPAIGVTVTPDARILPLDGSPLPVKVTVHAQHGAEGTVRLKLPSGWTADPAEAHFQQTAAGNSEPIVFKVTPAGAANRAYGVAAIVESAGATYTSGWRSVGYPGLRPYNLYRAAELKTRKVDAKLAPGLHVGYVMGPGDLMPEAMEAMGLAPHLLSDAELASADLSQWNVLVVGIRAYSTRPALTAAQPRLDAFVRNGGTLIVQYQSANFPAPFPLTTGRNPERVVDEDDPVKLLDTSNPLLNFPNKITEADFSDWVEERGHSFLESWDPAYTPLTETADPGQAPQRGGLLVAHPGRGTYIYVAYALYRQLPELVPGAYRIWANLLSAGKSQSAAPEAVR